MKSISSTSSISLHFILAVLGFSLCLSAFGQGPDYVSLNGEPRDEYRKELKELTLKNHRPLRSYSRSREYILQEIHLQKDQRGYFVKDVYCNRDFRSNVGPNRMPDHRKINIEHTWPQSRFSRRANSRYQKADLHHLYPSESDTNNARASHYFSDVADNYGGHNCAASKLGYNPRSGRTAFEPPQQHKGNVARALFYFSIRYDIPISEYEEFFLRIWNYADPVDEAELRRNDLIEKIQGNRNPFIDEPELVELLDSF